MGVSVTVEDSPLPPIFDSDAPSPLRPWLGPARRDSLPSRSTVQEEPIASMDQGGSPRPGPPGPSSSRDERHPGPRTRDAVAFLIAALAAIFLARVFYGREAAPLSIEDLPVSASHFDTVRALADVRALAETCPDRVTGSQGAGCAARFIEKRLNGLGLAVRTQTFPMWLRGRQVTGRNVFALSRGTSTRTMLLVAHYDAAATSRQAAADNASGVAVLLELARIFAGETRERSILFLATDASEWGMIGADRFAAEEAWKAAQGPHATPPYGAISLDFVQSGGARGIALHGSGQFEGAAPLWLRRLMAGSIRAAGLRAVPETLPRQIVARALRLSWQDQGPLLRHGIPAINLSTVAADPAGAREVYHTQADRMDRLFPGAVGLYGRAAEAAARALNAAGVTQSEDALSVTARKVLPAASARWIALALFLPLLTLAGSTIARRPAGLLRAGMGIGLLSLPPFAALLALRACALANVLPRFELYPATPKDPFLTTWQPIPMLLSLGAALLAALLASRAPRAGAPALRAAALCALCLAGLWAWTRNDVAAALFLAPAAWLWPWVGGFRGGSPVGSRPPPGGPERSEGRLQERGGPPVGRTLDAIFLLGGAAPFLILLALLARVIQVGPWILWYVPLQVAYGVWSLQAAAIAAIALAAAIALKRSADSAVAKHGETLGA